MQRSMDIRYCLPFSVFLRGLGRRIVVVACLALCLGGLVVQAAVLICKRCGYESKPAARFCAHCGVALKGGGAAVPLPAPEQAPTDGPFVFSSDPVSEDLKEGLKQAENERFELAALFFLNAQALNELTRDDKQDARARKLKSLLEQAMRGERTSYRKCPVCAGSGKSYTELQTLRGDVVRKEVPGRSCTECRGGGRVRATARMADRKLRLGRALRDYTRWRHATTWLSVGRVWVPEPWSDALGPEEEAALKRVAAPGCAECLGWGRVDCRKCDGAGSLPCDNHDCEDGVVTIEAKVTLGSGLPRRSPCQTCRGDSLMGCTACRGGGTVLCEECDGAGQLPACRKCDSTGLATCRRCHGEGTSRGAPCTSCGARGKLLCGTCNGYGRDQ